MRTLQLTCVVVLGVMLFGCSSKSGDVSGGGTNGEKPPLPKVGTIAPERKTLRRNSEQPGQVDPFEETEIVAKISGFIERIPVEMGDRVEGPQYDSAGKLLKEGSLLAVLNVPELEQERQQKEALVEQAEAAVKVADAAITSAKSLQQEAEAGGKRAAAVYERWQSELQRLTELAAQAAVTPKVVDETRSQTKSADAARDEAQAKLVSAKAGVIESKAKFEKAKADLKVAIADLKRVEALLAYREIRAPFDGVVSRRYVHTGHLVQAATGTMGKPLFTVTRTDKVRIFIDVPESDARFTELKGDVEIRIPAAGNKVLSSDKIAHTAWTLDPTTRTMKVEIDATIGADELRPGMYVIAMLPLVRKDVLTLPAAAILTDNGKSFCYVIEEGKAVRKDVVLGLRVGRDVEIASGLLGGEKVVSTGAANLTPGQAVEVMPPAKN